MDPLVICRDVDLQQTIEVRQVGRLAHLRSNARRPKTIMLYWVDNPKSTQGGRSLPLVIETRHSHRQSYCCLGKWPCRKKI